MAGGVDLPVSAGQLAAAGCLGATAAIPLRRHRSSKDHPQASQEPAVEDIMRAAGLAGENTYIDTLPYGYDTPLGEQALRLSAGQRQRNALARAFLRDAPLLLLRRAHRPPGPDCRRADPGGHPDPDGRSDSDPGHPPACLAGFAGRHRPRAHPETTVACWPPRWASQRPGRWRCGHEAAASLARACGRCRIADVTRCCGCYALARPLRGRLLLAVAGGSRGHGMRYRPAGGVRVHAGARLAAPEHHRHLAPPWWRSGRCPSGGARSATASAWPPTTSPSGSSPMSG